MPVLVARACSHPGLTAVIRYSDVPPRRGRPKFNVEEVYRNLVVDGELE